LPLLFAIYIFWVDIYLYLDFWEIEGIVRFWGSDYVPTTPVGENGGCAARESLLDSGNLIRWGGHSMVTCIILMYKQAVL